MYMYHCRADYYCHYHYYYYYYVLATGEYIESQRFGYAADDANGLLKVIYLQDGHDRAWKGGIQIKEDLSEIPL